MIAAIVAERRTALYEQHVAAGARVVDFFGWAMPIYYRGIVAEHDRVRATAGIFDVSHMGQIQLDGPGAVAAAGKLISRPVASLDVPYWRACPYPA